MMNVLLVRPGSTVFDEQGRITGSLDIPLTDHGIEEARKSAEELSHMPIRLIYSAPGLAAIQTARLLSEELQVKIKKVEKLRNIDRGLWHGMLVEELRKTQPRVFRKWQDAPDSICPPDGETMQAARQRVQKCLNRLIKKHDDETIVVVATEPMASIVQETLEGKPAVELWRAECRSGNWNLIEVATPQLATRS